MFELDSTTLIKISLSLSWTQQLWLIYDKKIKISLSLSWTQQLWLIYNKKKNGSIHLNPRGMTKIIKKVLTFFLAADSFGI